jgi:fatty acid-binding protein DegV
MRLSEQILIFGLAYTLAFGVIYSMELIHRQAYDKAFSAWYKNPTAENQAALQKEQHVNEETRLRDSAVGAVILVVAGYGVWSIVCFAKRKLT